VTSTAQLGAASCGACHLGDTGERAPYTASGGLYFQGAASTRKTPLMIYSGSGGYRFAGASSTALSGFGTEYPYLGTGGCYFQGAATTSQAGPGPVSAYGPTAGGLTFRGVATTIFLLPGHYSYAASGGITLSGVGATERVVTRWRLVLVWDVAPRATVRRLRLSWDVTSTRLERRLTLQWTVQNLLPALVLEWEVYPAELPAGAAGSIQVLAPQVTRRDGSTVPAFGFTVDADLSLPADQYTVQVAGTQELQQATVLDLVNIDTGLVVDGTTYRVPLIHDGVVDQYSMAEDPYGWTGTLKGRNDMAQLLDQTVSLRFTLPAPEAPVEEVVHVETLEGYWRASDIARIVTARVGLGLSWRCRDYQIQEPFDASGRPIDIISELVAPWSHFEPLKVDVFARNGLVIAQARTLTMTAPPLNHFPVRGGCLTGFSMTIQPQPALTSVEVEGMRAPPMVSVPVPEETIDSHDRVKEDGEDPTTASSGTPSDSGDKGEGDRDEESTDKPVDSDGTEQGDTLDPVDDNSGGVGGTQTAGDGGESLYGDQVTTGPTVLPDGTTVPAGTSVARVVKLAQGKGVQLVELQGPNGSTRYAGTLQTTETTTKTAPDSQVTPYLADTTDWTQEGAEARPGNDWTTSEGLTAERVTWIMPDQIVASVVKDVYQKKATAGKAGGSSSGETRISYEIQTKGWSPGNYGPTGVITPRYQLSEWVTKEEYGTTWQKDSKGKPSSTAFDTTETSFTKYTYDSKLLLREERSITQKSSMTFSTDASGKATAEKKLEITGTIKRYRTEGPLWVKIETDRLLWDVDPDDPDKTVGRWVTVSRDSQVQAGHRAGGILAKDVREAETPAQDDAAEAEAATLAIHQYALPGQPPNPDGSTPTPATGKASQTGRSRAEAAKTEKAAVINGKVKATKVYKDPAADKTRKDGSQEGKGARIKEENLKPEDVDYVVAQATASQGPSVDEDGLVIPGLWEHDLEAELVGVPWLLPGMVVQFTNWEASDGTVQDLPPALLYHVTHTYREGRGDAAHTVQVRAVFWSTVPQDVANATAPGLARRRAPRAMLLLSRLAGRRSPHATLTPGRSHSLAGGHSRGGAGVR
jgi:hypothetical protein